MEYRGVKTGAKLLGHHLHPMLIVFPLGLLSTAFIFDIALWATERRVFVPLAYWLIPAGLIGGGVAALFGWIDWFAIPSGTRAKTVGLTHGFVNVVVLLLFFSSWWLRPNSQTEPGSFALLLSVGGALLALVGGWLGGELVERLGIGVHPGAHADAPNSLTSDPPGVSHTEERNYEVETAR
jgi:uncharacterized membrane protein